MDELEPKQLVWVGSSRRELREFPPAVRRTFGVALFAAQLGETPPRRETAQGFWRRRRARTDRGSLRRHLPGGLYGAVRDQDICVARVSEEIEARHRNTETRARAHPRAAEMGRAIAHR